MGHRTNPIGLRLGVNRSWNALWFADKRQYASYVQEDLLIRSFFQKKLSGAGVSRVVISRLDKKPHVTVYVARPGVVIGKKGAGIDDLLSRLKSLHGISCFFNIVELRKPDLYAQVVADDIARQLEKRVSYKRAMKRSSASALKMGGKGIRISCGGRLGGIEIARTEWCLEGRLPLHSFRADIDYACSEAHTTSGVCGVKVWIYRGDILEKNSSLIERRLGETCINRVG
ncbi:30S ribosomal protein S3 [Holospora obtusa F1]|uniref:Small ribosomal subunit protein uS3 n=1 Tax=Holospora obtusa F1 TaxID=1399147 RepID=W6TTT5_HOLOB|nr:30S ribosomal protein S3 [Holospora obtusa]ETZ07202.1 30S ribosomal protein S3 [Holospora obtusa F1]